MFSFLCLAWFVDRISIETVARAMCSNALLQLSNEVTTPKSQEFIYYNNHIRHMSETFDLAWLLNSRRIPRLIAQSMSRFRSFSPFSQWVIFSRVVLIMYYTYAYSATICCPVEVAREIYCVQEMSVVTPQMPLYSNFLKVFVLQKEKRLPFQNSLFRNSQW